MARRPTSPVGHRQPLRRDPLVALLLRHSLDLESEARTIESAVERVISGGLRTADLVAPGERAASTREAGDAVLQALAH